MKLFSKSRIDYFDGSFLKEIGISMYFLIRKSFKIVEIGKAKHLHHLTIFFRISVNFLDSYEIAQIPQLQSYGQQPQSYSPNPSSTTDWT